MLMLSSNGRNKKREQRKARARSNRQIWKMVVHNERKAKDIAEKSSLKLRTQIHWRLVSCRTPNKGRERVEHVTRSSDLWISRMFVCDRMWWDYLYSIWIVITKSYVMRYSDLKRQVYIHLSIYLDFVRYLF